MNIAEVKVPDLEKRPRQMWINATARCYKCIQWSSNMPLSGRCLIETKAGLICSHDMMPGDGCNQFKSRY